MANGKKYTLKPAFSLAEVLISVLFIAVILLFAIPAITKKVIDPHIKLKGGQIGFYYRSSSGLNETLPCYNTVMRDDMVTLVKDNTGACEVYEFTVPKGVHKIDLTLVAGGGGGGGAAGGTVYEKEFAYGDTELTIPLERLKGLKINYITSKGFDGQKVQTNTNSNSAISAGKGGKSGAAVVDFDVPLYLIKQSARYSPDFIEESGSLKLSYETETEEPFKDYISEWYTNEEKSSCEVSDAIGLILKDSLGNFLFGFGSAACNEDNSIAGVIGSSIGSSSLLKSLISSSLKKSADGAESSITSSNTTTVSSGYVLSGGEGGKILGVPDGFGAGGAGQSLQVTCMSQYCNMPTTNTLSTAGDSFTSDKLQVIESDTSGKPKGANAVVSIESPGGVGGGGGGGTAVKIKDFSVSPGTTYKIVVGAGGGGGAKGRPGVISSGGGYKTVPLAGAGGASGSSTAIYDEDNKLVMMVIGGVGGNGGTINEEALTKINDEALDLSTYLPLPELPKANGNVPMLIMTDNTDLNLDTDIIYELQDVSSDTAVLLPDNSMAARKIVYAYTYDYNAPLFELGSNSTNVAKGTAITDRSNNESNNGVALIYPFLAYNNSEKPTFLKPDMEYYGTSSSYYLYNGLFFRYATGDLLSYAGGLGGFSGIGSKAGCGGLFVGNKDGRYSNIDPPSDSVPTELLSSDVYNLKDTFTVNIAANSDENNSAVKVFGVNDFFDGCSLSTSDGAAAQFVAPSHSAFTDSSLGMAGAGGGGGGWNSQLGPGNGGNGQNGYVFIKWR